MRSRSAARRRAALGATGSAGGKQVQRCSSDANVRIGAAVEQEEDLRAVTVIGIVMQEGMLAGAIVDVPPRPSNSGIAWVIAAAGVNLTGPRFGLAPRSSLAS